MNLRLRSRLLMLTALLSSVVMYGCGSSSKNTVSTTEETFYAHTAILGNHSTLYTSGFNGYGQLGNGTLDNRSYFQAVLGHVEGYAAGANHTVAYNGSTIWTWGSNFQGRLGTGATSSLSTSGSSAFASTPQTITMSGAVLGVAAGWKHSLAVVGAAGNVYAWGGNSYGQLGNLTLTNSSYGVPVLLQDGTALSQVRKVAAGGSHSMALRGEDDGTTSLWSWGLNDYGQLAQPGTPYAPFAVRVKAFDNYTSPAGSGRHAVVNEIAAAGSYSLARMVSAEEAAVLLTQYPDLKLDPALYGTVWAWGYGVYGQLGIGAPAYGTHNPVQVKVLGGDPLTGVRKISAGIMHVLALKKNETTNKGEVWAWGFNEKGQLGVGSASLFIPYAVKSVALDSLINSSPNGVEDIYAFGNQSFAKIDGVWYGWGDNGWGQLGQDVPKTSIANWFTPVQLRGVPAP